jgi:hypothetical protein
MLVFEQVLLFMLGVAIFLVCFVSFNSYSAYFVEAGNIDQIEQVSNYIAYGIVKLSLEDRTASSYYTLSVPGSIGGEMYRVNLTAAGLNVTTAQTFRYRFTGLYGLGLTTQLVNSETVSQSGVVVLYKNGNQIRLI